MSFATIHAAIVRSFNVSKFFENIKNDVRSERRSNFNSKILKMSLA